MILNFRCARIRRNLSLYHDNHLPADRIQQVEKHLLACESCRVSLDLNRVLSREMAMGGLIEDASPSFNDRVMAALRHGNQVRRVWSQWREFAIGTVVAAAVMGFALNYAASEPRINRPGVDPASAVKVSPKSLTKPFDHDPNNGLWKLQEDQPRRPNFDLGLDDGASG
jgi:hypothetical protein